MTPISLNCPMDFTCITVSNWLIATACWCLYVFLIHFLNERCLCLTLQFCVAVAFQKCCRNNLIRKCKCKLMDGAIKMRQFQCCNPKQIKEMIIRRFVSIRIRTNAEKCHKIVCFPFPRQPIARQTKKRANLFGITFRGCKTQTFY